MPIACRFLLGLTFVAALAACGGGGGAGSGGVPSTPTGAPSGTPSPPPNLLSVPSTPGATSVVFSGYTWSVRSDFGGPGPNQFDANNVWVDSSGFLHLKITDNNGTWTTAEVVCNQSLGFGTYQFQVLGHPESMDNHVVLGLFDYPPPAIGPDGTNEIDIEFATWDGAQSQHGNWTVWPAVAGPAQNTYAFDASPNTGESTHRFIWSSRSVDFQALSGLTNGTNGEYATWQFAPANYAQLIPQQPLPVHMNLWLINGPPSNGQEVEMVVTSFAFTP